MTLVGSNSAAALAADHPGKWLAPDVVYAGRADAPDLGMWGWSGLSEEASDARFASGAAAFVREHPADAARLAGWKLVRFADPDAHSAKDDAAMKRAAGWATWLPALILAALGVVAMLRGDPSLRPFAWLLAGVILTTLVFYGDARMRSAADPAILVLAAAGARLFVRPRIG